MIFQVQGCTEREFRILNLQFLYLPCAEVSIEKEYQSIDPICVMDEPLNPRSVSCSTTQIAKPVKTVIAAIKNHISLV